MYCPQHHTYIRYGMSMMQVMQACGQPTYKKEHHEPVIKKVPMTKLIYTNLNQGAVYLGFTPVYSTWSIPSGTSNIILEVDVVDNEVKGLSLNGTSSNAISVCGGRNVALYSNVSAIYAACGTPSMVNQTFISTVVPQNEQPEIWTYHLPYREPMTLTFVGGILQAIN